MGWLLGTERDVTVALRSILTVAQTRDSQMAAATRRAEEAFKEYALGSMRSLSLLGKASPEQWALRRCTYM